MAVVKVQYSPAFRQFKMLDREDWKKFREKGGSGRRSLQPAPSRGQDSVKTLRKERGRGVVKGKQAGAVGGVGGDVEPVGGTQIGVGLNDVGKVGNASSPKLRLVVRERGD